jgi:hypothetical protein
MALEKLIVQHAKEMESAVLAQEEGISRVRVGMEIANIVRGMDNVFAHYVTEKECMAAALVTDVKVL